MAITTPFASRRTSPGHQRGMIITLTKIRPLGAASVPCSPGSEVVHSADRGRDPVIPPARVYRRIIGDSPSGGGGGGGGGERWKGSGVRALRAEAQQLYPVLGDLVPLGFSQRTHRLAERPLQAL